MLRHPIAVACKVLISTIGVEKNPRERLKQCRQALGLGRQAVLEAAQLKDSDLQAIQSVLRLARSTSNGFCNTSA
jgi:hypothetical protein